MARMVKKLLKQVKDSHLRSSKEEFLDTFRISEKASAEMFFPKAEFKAISKNHLGECVCVSLIISSMFMKQNLNLTKL